MPYIEEDDRAWFNGSIINIVNTLRHKFDQSRLAGNLNYIITKIIAEYIKTEGYNYRLLNEIIGTLDNTKDELKRIVLYPYENSKIEKNGGVYDKS